MHGISFCPFHRVAPEYQTQKNHRLQE
jgi:hypothetical protein